MFLMVNIIYNQSIFNRECGEVSCLLQLFNYPDFLTIYKIELSRWCLSL
jgi:hypothetical protein